VKRKRLDFLAEDPRHTQRIADSVGWRCRSETIRDLAKKLGLDWHAVNEVDKQYMREQLRRAGTPGPKVMGIDPLSIRRRSYRIVVSDLVRMRPI
jgi:transposase